MIVTGQKRFRFRVTKQDGSVFETQICFQVRNREELDSLRKAIEFFLALNMEGDFNVEIIVSNCKNVVYMDKIDDLFINKIKWRKV